MRQFAQLASFSQIYSGSGPEYPANRAFRSVAGSACFYAAGLNAAFDYIWVTYRLTP
jgi:hypothetical protein